MKKILFVLMGLLCSLSIIAQTNFQEVAMEEALKMAKMENKPVFLDCYTSWCGPCKMMANEVFTLKEAGDYFNKNYVCVKLDMEKGEGPDIAKRYGVNAYPTFLVVSTEGKLITKVVGAMPLEELIENVECGINANSIAEYDALYKAGKLELTEQMTYWKLLAMTGEEGKAQNIGSEIWKKLSEREKLNPVYWPLMQSRATSLESEELKFVCDNRAYFEQEIGKEKVGDLIYNSFMSELKLMIVYQLPQAKYAKLPKIRELLQNSDIPRKETLLKITELAAARGEYDEAAFLDRLESGLELLNDSEKGTVFEGAKLFISPFKNRAYTQKLGELALRAREMVQEKETKDDLAKIGFLYRRCGRGEGVCWEELETLEEVLAQASVEGRNVFLNLHNDGQTTHLIDEKIFSQKEVGECLNKFFINYRINLKEDEGPKIARRYGVYIPNVMLVLDRDGNVLHQISNTVTSGETFVERVNEAFDENKASGILEAKYASGDRSPEFMVNYLTALSKMPSPKASLIAVELFSLLDDEQKISPEFWMLYSPQFSSISSEMKNYLWTHLPEFREKLGQEKVDLNVENQIYFDLSNPLYNNRSKFSAEDANHMIQFLKQEKELPHAKQLLCFAHIIKLFKTNVYRVKDYKKASKGMKAEEIPFIDLYSHVLVVAPERTEEWNVWGKEIMEKCTDAQYIKMYQKFLLQ